MADDRTPLIGAEDGAAAMDAQPVRTTIKKQRAIGDLQRLQEELPPLRTEPIHRLLNDVDYVTVLSVCNTTI